MAGAGEVAAAAGALVPSFRGAAQAALDAAVAVVRSGGALHDPHGEELAVQAVDLKTPDDWVTRHASMTRLTGVHPFNSEGPMPLMAQHGFVTPNSLHYTRSHGAVPKLSWEAHRVAVSCEAAGAGALSLSMADIVALPSVSLPVTLTCAGNRRKEENMTSPTAGFSWNTSATSTSIWTGARLSTVLRRLPGLPWGGESEGEGEGEGESKAEDAGGWHVWFLGADELPNGFYGTSLPLGHCMNPANDVLLAYKQNGEVLHPDRGFPVRLLVPGWIGGRMVKWLTHIEVRRVECDNWYHWQDNRILPPVVPSKEVAAQGGWWRKPEYLFNELNINSVITAPAHNLRLPLGSNPVVTFSGYAYSGGGRAVTRVELSLDGGATWRLAELDVAERTTRYNMRWCWVFWRAEVPVLELMGATECCVRAWDCASNTQPQQLTWNLLGMGNNCWFRVQVRPALLPDGLTPCLRFVHPTQGAGLDNKDAWMVPAAAPPPAAAPEPHAAATSTSTATSAASGKSRTAGARAQLDPAHPGERFSMKEVAQHDQADDCWIVVRGKVYDATGFLSLHPGGVESITMNGGTDCTEEFEGIHSPKAWEVLKQYCIGFLQEQHPESATSTDSEAESALGYTATGSDHVLPAQPTEREPAKILEPRRYVDFVLTRKTVINHNTILLRFTPPENVNGATMSQLIAFERSASEMSLTELAEAEEEREKIMGQLRKKHHTERVLGLPVGQHLLVKGRTADGRAVVRAYTPLVDIHEAREDFSLLVKVYRTSARHPLGGRMTQWLDSLPLGATVPVKGPLGHISYAQGELTVHGERRCFPHIAFICGGSGITPAFRILRAALEDARDTNRFTLLYSNSCADDILLRAELEELARRHAARFKLWFTITLPGDAHDGARWCYSTGRVDADMIRTHIPLGDDGQCFVGLCGPPGLVNDVCVPCLQDLGYAEACIGLF